MIPTQNFVLIMVAFEAAIDGNLNVLLELELDICYYTLPEETDLYIYICIGSQTHLSNTHTVLMSSICTKSC